jgi:hypothetical protein
MEQLDYNLRFRWFVGLSIDDAMWDRSVFSLNRDRLLDAEVGREFFNRVLYLAEWQGFVSDEHFSVDGTLIEVWASHKCFVRKDDGGPERPPGRNPEVDFKGEVRSNATHESSTDPESRLYKKGEFTEAKLRYMAHALTENRHGLVVDVETTGFRRRKMIEESFGWIKTVGGLRKSRHIGLAKLTGHTFAAYNLTRLLSLIQPKLKPTRARFA